MADRTINININITGSTTGTGGKGSSGGSSSVTQQKEEAKRLTIQLKEEEKRRTLDHAAELKKQSDETKRAYKVQTDAAKKAAKEQTDEVKKATAKNSNTWANAISSYQFKFNALGNIISNVVSTSTRMLYQLGSSVVTISKDFEFSMSGVRAITNATDAEFKALTNDAIRLGGLTLYTATEVSKLQEELAKLGFTVPEIRAATDGVVALAAATGEDLSESALVAGTVIRGFGLQAYQLTGVVDVMAQSFNSSALDLYKFSETMKYVAPVAAKVGFTMEETTAIMAKLADQGIVASQAGTGLRNLFLRLADANSKLSKAIGFTVNSLPELVVGFKELNKAGLGATEALKLADRYSVTALLGLAQGADKIWDLYKSLISSSDAAQKMSEIRMDNFSGSVEKLTGAWDSLVLTINKGNGVLKTFVDIGTGALEFLQQQFGSYEGKIAEESNKRLQGFKKIVNNDIREKKIAYIKDAENLMDQYDRKLISKEEFGRRSEALDVSYENQYKNHLLERLGVEIDVQEKTVAAWENGNMIKNGSQQKLFDSTKKYIIELKDFQISAQQEATKTLIEQTEAEVNSLKEKEWKVKQLRIDAMVEGLNKELAEVALHYDKLESEASEFGIVDIDFTKARERAKLDTIKEYNDKQNRERERALSEIKKFRKEVDETMPDKYMPQKMYKKTQYDEAAYIRERFADIRKAFKEQGFDGLQPSSINFNPDLWATEVVGKLEDGTEIVVNKLKADTSKNADDWNIFDKFIQGELTSAQKQALKKGFDWLSNQLQSIADKEVEIANTRVENSANLVSQLQQDLETEIALGEAGYANNISLKQKELDAAKKQQTEALRLQEVALKKQQQVESLMQAANLASAISGILKNTFTKLDPVTASIISIGSTLALFGIWNKFKGQTESLTAYGDGGEINGPKHSQGGVPIVAEGGEYMIRADAYAKNKDLVQAINNEDMSSVYRSLNQDLSVSLDDSNTARMLGRHFKDKKEVVYHDKCRIETVGNRRRVIRYA